MSPQFRTALLLARGIGHLVQLRLLLVRQHVVPLLKVGNVLPAAADEEVRQVLLRLVVSLPVVGVPAKGHQFGLGRAQGKIERVVVILPALLLIVLVVKLGTGHGGRGSAGGSPGTRGREELFDQDLDNLESGRDDGVLVGPLGQDDLQPALAPDLDLAEELDHGQSGKDEDERLDEGSGLRSGQSVGNGLQKLRQEWAQTVLSSLLDQLSSQSAHLGGSIVFDRRAQQPINDVQAHLQTRPAVGVVPVEDLLVVVLQNPLDGLGSGPQDVAKKSLALKSLGPATYRNKGVVLGQVGNVESASQRGQDARAQSGIRSGVREATDNVFKRLGDEHGDLEVAGSKLGQQEEKIDGRNLTGNDDCAVEPDGGSQSLRESNKELVCLFHFLGILAVHVALDGGDNGCLAVRGHASRVDKAFNGLDAGNLNNLRLFVCNGVNDGVDQVGRGLVRAADDAADEISSGAQQRVLGLVDREVDKLQIGVGNGVRNGLTQVLEVADKHDEQVQGCLLASPGRGSLAREEGLCVSKQAVHRLLVEPLAQLDEQVASGRAGGVVGRDRSLLCQVKGAVKVPQVLLLARDPRVSDEHLHKIHHPRDLVTRGMGVEVAVELRLDGRCAEALVEEVELLQDEEIEGIREVVGVFQARLHLVDDVQLLVGRLHDAKLFPHGGEEGGALGEQKVREDPADAEERLDHLQLEGDDAVPGFGLGAGARLSLRQTALEDGNEEGVPLLQQLLRKYLDVLVVILDHVHQVEASAEDGDGEGAQHGLPALVEGDFGKGLGDVLGHGKELVLAEALVDQITEHPQRSVELGIVASGDDIEDGGEEGGPLVGEVVNGNLANGVTRIAQLGERLSVSLPSTRLVPGGDLDLSVVLGAERNLEQRLLEQLTGLVRDGDLRLVIELLHGPVLLDEEAQRAEGGLADARVDGRVRADAGQRHGKGGIRLGALDLDLGRLAGSLVGELRVGQELRQLVLHGGRG
ncbi:hypothetical protein CCMA1212_007687 [Trichoderma ghanense]|uniref:Uncharacterized protein n=1 Tax=Trichoderma ghanense TaxID=65468 RepID=A0ABY2GXF5_9HYPO